MEVAKLEELKKEVKSLNLNEVKDYIRFKNIRNELKELFKHEFERGRVPDYGFIIEKEQNSFEDYPTQGFEYYESFKNHFDKYYLNKDFENYEQEQYMYNDLALQYKRRLIFNN